MGIWQASFPRKFVNLGGMEKLICVNSHPVLSISTATFPDKWKLARVISIQKEGTTGPRNYPPISGLTIFVLKLLKNMSPIIS